MSRASRPAESAPSWNSSAAPRSVPPRSACATELDDQLSAWRDRPMGGHPYLMLDARYEKVRHGGHLLDCAVLIAIGIEARATAPSWASASPSVKPRSTGVLPPEPPAPRPPRRPGRQRCPRRPGRRAHASSPACPGSAASSTSSRTPRPMSPARQRAAVAQDIRGVFDCPQPARGRSPPPERRRQVPPAPPAGPLDGKNLPQGFTVFAPP